MATTTGTLVFYESFIERIAEDINMSSDTFICGLSTSSYSPSASTHNDLTDITNEVSGNGYSRDTLDSSPSWSQTSGTATFDTEDPVFTASGGSIVARYYWLFDDTPTTAPADPLMFYGLLDNSPADVTTTDGNTLTINVNASGWFTIS